MIQRLRKNTIFVYRYGISKYHFDKNKSQHS
jgi:hypothetical protein